MSAHAVLVTQRVKPGQRPSAEAVWNRIMTTAITANPDHSAYVYVLPVDEPYVIRAFQLYRTAAAAFLWSPEYLEYADVEAVLVAAD